MGRGRGRGNRKIGRDLEKNGMEIGAKQKGMLSLVDFGSA
jgi:hypothetical protein